MQDTFPSLMGEQNQSGCVFMTEYVSPLDSKKPLLKEEDFFIQFDMPIDILPSFKGLSVLIQYNLEIKIDEKEPIRFPFTVEGEGQAPWGYITVEKALSHTSQAWT